MSQLRSVMEDERVAQRATALRTLLARPLVLASDAPEAFAAILRNREWLATWFADHAGWKLAVESSAGFARLHKIPASPDPTRGARIANRVFDRRRYALFCLLLAACDEVGAQTTLASLARAVEELSAEDDHVPTFDPTSGLERRAFVDAVRLLTVLGVLRVRDGDAERYAQTTEGDALFDVHERVLGQLVSAPVPPAFAGDPDRILDEPGAETDEGDRLRHRQHAVRRLLDDPVLYFEDLERDAFAWVDHSRGFLYRLLQEDAGLHVERRAEGLAAIDPAGTTTDTSFPDGGSTIKHAAILLAERLVAHHRERGERVATDEVVRLTRRLHAEYGEPCRWSKQYPGDDEGCARLAEDAMELLESFALVARGDGDWRIRPAIARFRPGKPASAARRTTRSR